MVLMLTQGIQPAGGVAVKDTLPAVTAADIA